MHSQNDTIAAVVLAAGKGTRMKSELSKVLHPLCGLSMVGHVINTLTAAGINDKCIVVGGDVDQLQSALRDFGPLTFTLQKDRLGTGEAVACGGFGLEGIVPPSFASGSLLAGPKLNAKHILICAGDTPAMDPDVIKAFVTTCLGKKAKLAVLGMAHPEPKGYGRLITNDADQLLKIVEEKDASDAERKVGLCNSGVIFAEAHYLFSLLGELTQANAQREYYLTDCFALSLAKGLPALVWTTTDYASFDGVNDRMQLARLEERVLQKLRSKMMSEGVSFTMASSTYIEVGVQIGADTWIGPHASLSGLTKIGRNCEIGSHVDLKNVIIPDGTKVPAGTIRNG
ncbi:MAG: NTP transferase domain-containing protein [Chitinophagaceae bacterium]|nr:NTP transferase domain-containing protein [Oligoflexus sp.]